MPEGNPYPTLRPAWAGTEHVAWDEGYEAGAAAGVAASEARAVERFDRAFAEYASRHAGPFPGELVAHLRAALLSEEAS